MCNRYSVSQRKVRHTSRFGSIELELEPRYNIAPTQTAPVALVKNGALAIQDLRWGFEGFNGQPVTNARSETAHEKRMFRDAWREQHCLVPADGFYEWKQMPDGKQPFRFVQRDRELFWFAGLWTEDRFTILTAPALGCVREVHDRMPIILRADALDSWLENNPCAPEEIISRCVPADSLESYPVTRAMSNARHLTPDCIEPIVIAQRELLL